MAAQGNQTSYQRAEGESTQWEDIQRKLGNMPPAKPVERVDETALDHARRTQKEQLLQKSAAFTPAQEPDKVRDLIEATDEDALEQLEDDFADDAFLQQYRQHRLQQLKANQQQRRYGSMEKIMREQFVQEVTQASKDAWVVVHLYKDKVPASSALGACLEALAKKFTLTKFLKIISNDCIPNYPDANLPTLLVYKDGQCKHNLVGLLQCGGRPTPDTVAGTLNRLGPICTEDAIGMT